MEAIMLLSLLLLVLFWCSQTDIRLQKCPLLWVDVYDPHHKLTLAIYLTASFGENSAKCYYIWFHNAELIHFQCFCQKRQS